MSEPFRVDARRCLHETLDGDTIVIDSARGWLLVFDGIASTIWQLMVPGSVPDSIREEVRNRYGAKEADEVGAFLDELESAGLVVTDGEIDPVDPATADWPSVYVAPTVNRFDDVADILMMDPIHEVEIDEGWPNAPRPPTSGHDG